MQVEGTKTHITQKIVSANPNATNKVYGCSTRKLNHKTQLFRVPGLQILVYEDLEKVIYSKTDNSVVCMSAQVESTDPTHTLITNIVNSNQIMTTRVNGCSTRKLNKKTAIHINTGLWILLYMDPVKGYLLWNRHYSAVFVSADGCVCNQNLQI